MKSLRVLLVEDTEDDARLTLRELARAGYGVSFERVQNADEMQRALREQRWDVVLSDYSMPDFDALAALGVMQQSGQDLPFIVISGTVSEEMAVSALKSGAHDFVVKQKLARLIPAIERELRDAAARREVRRSERALRESELKYRRIVETAQEGIWVVDADARISYLNQHMARMLRGSAVELIGSSVFDFVDKDWQEAVRGNFERLREGNAEQREFKFLRRDGSELWACLSSTPMIDESGHFSGTLAMVTDLTEQRNLQAQLLIADRMASIGVLVAGVAHEINNPLAAVLANIDLARVEAAAIKRRMGDSAELGDLEDELRDAQEAAQHVQHIVRDLKVFAPARDDENTLVDVEKLLDVSIRLAVTEIRGSAKLIRDFAKVPPVEGNAARLAQVFLNLIVNAAQAIKAALATKEMDPELHEIRVRTALADDGRVLIEVQDTGPGMSPEIVKRLFTSFFTTKPSGVGTGLGLSICQRIVSSLGGEIAIDSLPGRGTKISVWLRQAAATLEL